MKRNRLILTLLLFVLAQNSLTSQNIGKTYRILKDFAKTSAEMRNRLSHGKTAKQVRQVRCGEGWTVTEHYTAVIDYNDKAPFFCCIDSGDMQIAKVEKNKFWDINRRTNELTEFKKSKDFLYRQYRNHLEVNHYCLSYYQCPLPKLPPDGNSVPWLDKMTDTVIRNVSCVVYTGEIKRHYYKNSILEKPAGTLREVFTYYINKNDYHLDSVTIIETRSDGMWNLRKEYLTDLPSFDYEAFAAKLDFDNPEYTTYSRHDNKNLPHYLGTSDEKDVTQELLSFPLVNLSGEESSIGEYEGWMLLYFWQFGCGPCYETLKKLGMEKTTEGQTALEKAGVKPLFVNPLSDNMELIGTIADKYNVNDLLYAGKGMTSLIEINSYPTYYLISPEKKVALTGHSLDIKAIIKAATKDNPKNDL